MVTYTTFMQDYLPHFCNRNFYWVYKGGDSAVLYYSRHSMWELIKIYNDITRSQTIFTFKHLISQKESEKIVLHQDIISCKRIYPKRILMTRLP